jgi:hypothetical protein
MELCTRYEQQASKQSQKRDAGMPVATLKVVRGGDIYMTNKLGGAILAVAVVVGLVGSTALTAQAQRNSKWERKSEKWERNRSWRRDDDNDRRWRSRQNTRLHGRGYNNGRYGYPGLNNGRYGNGRYRNDGYYGNNGYYGSNNNYELNRGYQQGLSTGSSDARRGQSYSPERSRHYRNASSQAFLQGFVRGYDQGYRQYAGYNNNGYYNNNSGSVLGRILGLPF